MKWFFIGLFALGCFSAMATYGADNPKQKKIYMYITIIIWVIILILANILL